jgi:hypothetical protein
MNSVIRQQQESICSRFGAEIVACPNGLKVGVSRNVREGILPINGVRVQPERDTTGWYIWAGEWSDDPAFFVPLHVDHLAEWCPSAIPYLLLPPGWRFQVAPNHEDVWFDSEVQTDNHPVG